MKLISNIYVETEFSGANVSCVITNDGMILIDTPHRPTDAIIWKSQIEREGTVRYIINTESHDDHYTGNFFFNVPVIAQERAREAISKMELAQLLQIIKEIDPDGIKLVENYQIRVPTITFSERLTLYLGRHSFHLIHLPGHCTGQIAVYIPEERIVCTGDTVACRTQGFLHDADPIAWLESLKRLGDLDVDYIVPGHGEICDKSYLKEQADFIRECMDKIKLALQKGWTKKEATERISFERYSMDKCLEYAGPIMLKMSVENLYEYFNNL